MIVLLIGAPGAGKGTLAKYLSDTYKILAISTGDLIRKIINNNDNNSDILKYYVNKGRLVPSDVMSDILLKELKLKQYNKGFILDGYPRTIDQCFSFDLIFNEAYALLLEVKNELLIQRITGRFNCTKCGQIYNQYLKRPLEINKCDICSSNDFTKRVDDNENIFNNRLIEYKKEIKPIIDYYKSKSKLTSIDANLDQAVIAKNSKIKLDKIFELNSI